LEITSDAEALLELFFALRNGIVLIAGTGSICLGVRHTRRGPVVSRVGGWGSYLDQGCGFRLGLGALSAALRALDGRGEATPMTHLLCDRYGLTLDQVPGHFLPIRREQVADLARVAVEASSRGDPAAKKLVRRTVADLVEMVEAVAGKLGLVDGFRLVLSGGLFETARISRPFKRILKRRLPTASLIQVSDPLACLIHRYWSSHGNPSWPLYDSPRRT
jgi:N-acetylglucosamine kinase-like BadF-type ATPase